MNEFVLGMLAQHAQVGDEHISSEMMHNYPANTTTSHQVCHNIIQYY